MIEFTPREQVLRDLLVDLHVKHAMAMDEAYPDVGMGLSEFMAKKHAVKNVDEQIAQLFGDLTTMVRAANHDQ